ARERARRPARGRDVPRRRGGAPPRRCRARRGVVRSAPDADHRRNPPGEADRSAEGRAHTTDRRPRPRGALQPRRAGRRGRGARPLRRLGRPRARGALARRKAVRVRRDGRGGVPRDPRQPRDARADRRRRDATRLAGRATRRAHRRQTTRAPAPRPALRALAGARAAARRAAAGSRRRGGDGRRGDGRTGRADAPARPRDHAALRFRPSLPLCAMNDRSPIVAINPGTFDPVTFGHVDVIRRAAAIFDRVVVGVVRDPHHKQTTFTVEERVAFLEDALAGLDNVVVDVFSQLVVDFARKHGARTMVKGLRVIADFEWEFQMNRLNHLLAPEVETMYVMSSPEFAFVSSSGVKEIASFGGNVEGLVTAAVAKRFREMYPNGRPGAPLSPQD